MKSIYSTLFLFFLCSFSPILFAADEEFTARLEGNLIAPGNQLELVEDKYPVMQVDPNWSNHFTNYTVKNKIWLGLNPENTLTTYEDCEVVIDIDYRLEDGTLFTTSATLSAQYDNNGVYLIKDKSTFTFEGAHLINITIVQVTSGSIENFILQSEIHIERYYNFDGDEVLGLNSHLISNQGYIEFFWAPKYGAESYELEYVHINDYTLDAGTFKDPATLWYDFYENSTRINTDKVSYQIPNTFNHGYIIYRVRAIGRHGVNFDKRKEGSWCMQNKGTVKMAEFKMQITHPFNDYLNWSYSAGISENGKRIEGVSFVDRLGRQRQQLMHNPETKQIIISNTYYDYHGRAVIQDLGTPVNDEVFKHYPGFNRSAIDGQPFAPKHFDEEDASGACPVLPDKFDIHYGTGQYYSDYNPNIDGENHNIPNAGGYPYRQIQYMPDQTGRIKRTGAFGETHQIGNGKETEYMYSIPSQEELNRLFGSEVGYAKQYQRRMMRDANGQVYVTYYDLAGRVIASGMAGVAPQGIQSIPGNDPVADVETTLIDESVSDLSWSKPQEVLSDGYYTFNYEFTPEEYQDTCMVANICFDCVYDLTLLITDAECDGDTLFKHIVQINGMEFNELCNSLTHNLDTVIFLNAGSYHYSRNISVNHDAIDEYWCSYLNDNSCWNEYSAVYNNLYNSSNFDGCQLSEFDFGIGGSEGMSSCEYKENIMRMQLSPNGQYAKYDIATNGDVDASNYPLSIFNISNYLPHPSASWKNPTTAYLNEQGDSAFVEIIKISPGVYSPELSATTHLKSTSQANIFLVPPQHLKNAKDFIASFRKSWASSLLDYHPEACYLAFCYLNESSEEYNNGMDTIRTFQEACSLGYFNPLGITYTEANPINPYIYNNCFSYSMSDPFFSSGGAGFSFLSEMKDTMANFIVVGDQNPITIDIWTYSILVIEFGHLAPDQAVNLARKYRPDNSYCNLDQIWIYYKKLYKQLKQSYYQLGELDYVMENDCYNGCFETSPFDPSMPLSTVSGVQYFNNYTDVNNNTYNPSLSQNQPCNASTAQHYQNKTPVFLQYYGLINLFGGGNSAGGYATAQNYYDSSVVANGLEMCERNAEDWIASLSDCDNINTTVLAAIKAELIELCQLGVSTDYLEGVSSLTSTSTSNNNQSFEEVLQFHLGAGYASDLCNVYLFENLPPEEGNPDPPLTAPETYLDDCGCDVLFNVRHEYDSLAAINVLPLGVSSIEDMLYFNTQIQVDDVDSWLCDCEKYFPGNWPVSGQWNEEMIHLLRDEKIIVPQGLACNDILGLDLCLDCADINVGLTEMNAYFGSLGVNDISTSENYELILKNYMNKKFKYHLSGESYSNFIKGCNATPSDPFCYLSDEITSWIQVMDLLAKRGQLNADVNNPIDLYNENIVYEHGDFGDYLQQPYYWSCEGGTDCDEDKLTVYFGTNSSDACSFTLNFTEQTNVDLNEIIGFSALSMVDSDCNNSSSFRMIANYLDCGVIKQAIVEGTTDCIDVTICSCGDTGQLLCDDEIEMDYEVDFSECFTSTLSELEIQAFDLYQDELTEAYNYFETNYIDKCSQAFKTESYTYKGGFQMYQFTLFYYDQAGNLIKTIAPEGVKFSDPSNNSLINQTRNHVSGINDTQTPGFFPNHDFVTEYHYNSYGQLTKTTNPDQEVDTKYWYDRYGRILASQNPHQADKDLYSYTFYDEQGRPEQVGQVKNNPLTESIAKEDDLGASFKNWVEHGDRIEVTVSIYDEALSNDIENKFQNGQNNLRLRVASILYFDEFFNHTIIAKEYTTATHYSYDPHGNVVETLQDVPLMKPVEQDIKSTQYDYDLISGNMNKVEYQKGEIDGFTHMYYYDELNRLKEVQTSTDNQVHISTDAKYQYYDYGPLARVETGEYQVQGTDYAYTINGWLKGANSNTLDPNRDMGKDGTKGYYANNLAVHRHFAKDAFGFTLNYFEGDYRAIGTNKFEAHYSNTPFGNASANLYNGNIRHMVTAIEGMEIQGYAYTYDQLQRLNTMKVFRSEYLIEDNDWKGAKLTDDYFTRINYDKNGNILTLQRNGYKGAQLEMDRFEYFYETIGGNPSNRLNGVKDSAPNYAGYDDIKDGSGYKYNRLGELVYDDTEAMKLEWRYGDHKLKNIERLDQNSPNVEFIYNPLGVRVAKIIKPRSGGVVLEGEKWKVTYYSYDANGQLMATYNSDLYNGTIKETKLEEQYIYGSKRVGVIKANKVLYDEGPVQASTSPIKDNFLGKKRYELTNHLGNVLVTVSDRKVWNNTDGNYEPVITMKADYYAFGMLMPGRNEGISDARHLFNGMEHDMEVSGEGNSYTTEFRQYDPRLGRWKSLDPLMGIQAHLSPYQAFNNNPIYFVDPLGLIGGPAKEMPNYDLSDGEPEKVQDLEGITVKADLNVKSPSFLKQMWWNATGSWHKSRAMKTASIVGARESQMTELDENTILLRTGIEGTDNSLYSVFRKSKKNKSFTEYFSVKSNDDLFLTIDDVMDEDFILLSSIVLDAPDPATSTVKGGLVLMKHGGGFFRLLLKGRKAFSTKQAKQKVRFGVGGADDVLNKGFHVHIDGLEFGLRPGGGGQIGITQVGKKSSSLLQVNHAVKVFERAMSNKIFRDELLIHLKKTHESLLSKYGKGSINYQRAVDKSHEIHYLIQSLLNY